MVVGFEMTTFEVQENVGVVQLCVVVTDPPMSQPELGRAPFSLNVSHSPITAGNY